MGQRVAVFGATGYTGRELLRLLQRHPGLEVSFATGSGAGHLAHEAGLERAADAYLLALPHGVSARFAARLRRERPKAVVVDLSGDLRLPNADSYRAWYGQAHPEPALLGETPYGLTELNRDRLRGARLVANPGCYATSVLLPLVPLLRARAVDESDVVVDAKSGATGAGRTLREDLLFCELADDFSAYAPGRVHRHVGEIEAFLQAAAGAAVTLTFCPHLLPVKRGILSALYVKSRASAAEAASVLRRAYDGEPFVRVVEAPPKLSDVAFTNECRISVHAAAPGRLVVFSALDNLLKGAAGQALQNLNLCLGFEETAGLPCPEPVAAGAVS
ncbi:MAG TPA: N-acetyl-gamma-glutamyl-phosphate reductase [Vicinamibacteria bacterium]|nr:N-acetyl-gamma-glutamyl-phosphate reductase [Vicinamibacteria bacterium]